MSNHLHVVVRTLPDTVQSWTDEQVARRWLQIFPGKRILARRSKPPTALEIQTLCLDREKLAKVRIRLADISWFMRSLNEPIARRANQEDQCTGRFWEGRFKCQNLDDEGGVLSCTNVEAYSELFHRVVGKIHRLGEIARATGRSWLQGQPEPVSSTPTPG